MNLNLLAVAILTLAVACSKKDVATADSENSEVAKKTQKRRSFDPDLSSPQKKISALEVAKEKAEKSGVNPSNPEIRGCEANVAEGIIGMEDGDARNLAMVQLFSQWVEADVEAAMAYGNSQKARLRPITET